MALGKWNIHVICWKTQNKSKDHNALKHWSKVSNRREGVNERWWATNWMHAIIAFGAHLKYTRLVTEDWLHTFLDDFTASFNLS